VRQLTRALESMRRELEERHALEAFVADLSHELKNPIASIRASAEVLEEGAADDPKTARQFARRIRQSSDKLQALTADLLSLARLEARGFAPRIEALELRGIAREAIEALTAQASRRKVKLELRGDEPGSTKGDATWLKRAVENLIANAVQHSPEGGRVTLSLSPALLGEGAERKEAVALRVLDEGPGVEPGRKERLFVRFATTRHGEGGTGLGLALVRAVAELHGGAARLVERESASGAMFELVLPRE
jgi:signal transduction histidine kinase